LFGVRSKSNSELCILPVPMNYWITNRKRIEVDPPPKDAYMRTAYDFAREWLSGKEDFILYTSGSTGVPKPISVNRRQLLASVQMTYEALSLKRQLKALVCLNIRYIAGIMMLIRGLELDWELVIQEPSANPMESLEEELPLDFIAMVPLQLHTVLANFQTRKYLETCRMVLLGGAPVSVALEAEIKNLTLPVYQSYGMTETVSHVALRQLNGATPKPDYTMLRGIQFGTDHRGCLYLKGAVTQNQIVQTNDLVEITSENTFLWLGRIDSVINSGGIKIQLEKLDRLTEEVLMDIGSPTQFFNWYEPDEKLGQKLVLFIENNVPLLKADRLLNKLSERMSSFEVPKAVYFVDSMLRTPTDKIDKLTTAQAYFTSQQ
jgi:o-succinylbenzoate---CoA ligase